MQIGIDEVGRGCWAGPLLAAAVILNPEVSIVGLNDSKKLTKLARERLLTEIKQQALAIGIGWVWPAEIDDIGLTKSVAKAMELALLQIRVPYDDILIDGNYNFLPQYLSARTMVGADGLVPCVSAASIVAKVARDKYMSEVAAADFPNYGFERHVGYGTVLHIQALHEYGVTDIHRRSYKPIQQFLLQSDA